MRYHDEVNTLPKKIFWPRDLFSWCLANALFKKKIQVISLYCFAAQQQISAFRGQELDTFFSKFKAELNDLIPNLQM